jgi:signal peptidase II
MRVKNRLYWIATFIAVVLDQLTKYWVVQSLKYWQVENITDARTGFTIARRTLPLIQNVFHLTYVTNTGAGLGKLPGTVDWLRWVSLAVSIALIAWALFGPALQRWEQLGYGFILGGAMGNGIDRFVLRYVVDFFDFRLINFYIFNVADIFISVGLGCLLLDWYLHTRKTSTRRL